MKNSALGFQADQAEEGGTEISQLSPCPLTRNCVCSHSTSLRHSINPFYAEGPVDHAFKVLETILLTMNRCQLVTSTSIYLHAEFRSLCLGFVDDAEFLLSPSENVIHVRSASRVGYWDLGVNRRRIRTIRQRLEERMRHTEN